MTKRFLAGALCTSALIAGTVFLSAAQSNAGTTRSEPSSTSSSSSSSTSSTTTGESTTTTTPETTTTTPETTTTTVAPPPTGAGDATVITKGGQSLEINVGISNTLHFSPGIVHVKSGANLTFTDQDTEADPHTLTVVNPTDLPQTIDQVFGCQPVMPGGPPSGGQPPASQAAAKAFAKVVARQAEGVPGGGPDANNVCNKVFQIGVCIDPRIADPSFPPEGFTELFDVNHTAGLSAPYDTLLIGNKGSITVPVTAKADTTLYFMCVIHPW